MTPSDALTFSVAERRLDKRIDELERRLSEWKVECRVDAEVQVRLPERPERPDRAGWIIALSSIALFQAVAIVFLAVP